MFLTQEFTCSRAITVKDLLVQTKFDFPKADGPVRISVPDIKSNHNAI